MLILQGGPWTPAFAGATNRARMPCPKRGTTARRQWRSRAGSAFPFCSAERSPRPAGIVASMSEPAGRVSTRPAGRGWSEGTGASRRCGRGASLVTFSSPQESHSPAGARPGQSPPTESTQNQTAKIKTLDPACAGATNRVRMPCPKRRHHSPPAMAKPSRRCFPFCSAECSPRPAGIVASMSEPAGRVSTRPAGRGWSEGTGASRRCGRGAFW